LIGLSIKNIKIRIVLIESGYGLVVRAEVSNPIDCGFESRRILGGCNQSYFFEKKTTIGSQLGYTKNKVNFFLQQKKKKMKNILLKNQHYQEPLQQLIQLH
jgi:hypothetical protein